VEGVAAAVHMVSGDCVLLQLPRPFRIASDLSLPSLDAVSVFSAPANVGIATLNGGGDFSGVGGVVTLQGHLAGILLQVLPPIVHIHRESDRATLRWVMDRMRHELREQRPGGPLVLQHPAQCKLVEALRAYVAEGARGGAGRLLALTDKHIGLAISARHKDLANQWTLQTLAQHSARIAPMFGYDSKSAFSIAFKRVMGCSPRQYARGRTSAIAEPDEGVDNGASSPERVAD
jgi:hypothetical protein